MMKKTLAVLISAAFITSAYAISPRDAMESPDKPSVSATTKKNANPVASQAVAVSAALAPAQGVLPFGASLFGGRFSDEQFTGFNPDYQIAVGDRVSVKIWGAFTFDQVLAVDPQGNVFIPNVGPVAVKGVQNSELNNVVAARTSQVYKSNVGVYAALEAAQPVKLFVTGAVAAPGLYAGVSADSLLRFLDKAGGIDPHKGSYVNIVLQRNGQVRAQVNLYDFLTKGHIESVQLHDGDVLVVAPRQATVLLQGEVLNQNLYELAQPEASTLGQLLRMARVKPSATHAVITHQAGAERRSKVVPLTDAAQVPLTDGDVVEIMSEQQAANISVRVQGAHGGPQNVVLPYGASLGDVLKQLKPNSQSNVDAVQVFRKSVAERQKKALDTQLAHLQQYTLTSRSDTREEGELRKSEADLVMKFIEHAKTIQPKGQVVLPPASDKAAVVLEEGDVVFIPEKSSVVMVHGEVTFPNAVAWTSGKKADYYINQVGGYTKGSDRAQVLVVRADGTAVPLAQAGAVQAGDELYVLPKVESKNIEVTRSLTEILFRIAFVAKVALGI